LGKKNDNTALKAQTLAGSQREKKIDHVMSWGVGEFLAKKKGTAGAEETRAPKQASKSNGEKAMAACGRGASFQSDAKSPEASEHNRRGAGLTGTPYREERK